MVILGVLVLAVAIYALREPNGHGRSAQGQTSSASSVAKNSSSPPPSKTSSPASSKPAASSSAASSSPAVKSVPLVVLNNTSTPNLATDAAKQFENGGWKVSSVDNLSNDIVSTCAYYDPADPLAQQAAQALQAQFPAIKRVRPKFAELPSGPVVVVLTQDYSTG